MNFFGDGDKPKGLFLGWHRREKFGCFFEARRWDCFNFPTNYLFGGVGCDVWRKLMGMFFFVFLSFVIW